VGRLAPRASVIRITARKGPLNTCQKATLSLEKDCSYENSNSHSLTAAPTFQFQNSTLPYPPRFTPTQPTYGRSVNSCRDPSKANRCLSQSNAEKCLFDRPGLSTFWRNDNIGPSASHPTITTAPAPPRTPRTSHPAHTHPTPSHPPRTLPASPQPSPPIGPSASHPTISTAPAPPHTPHTPHPTHTHPTPTHPPRTLPASRQPSASIGPSASHPTISTAPAHPTHPTHPTLPTTTPPQPTVPRPSRTPRTQPVRPLAFHATWNPTFNISPTLNITFHVARFLRDSLYASNIRYNGLHLFSGSYGHADRPDPARGHPAPR